MEVTPKTKSDIKGGTLINFKGETRLLEIAQVPSNRIKEFKNIQNFKLFNTNNIWIKFNALKDVIENATMDLDVIVNPKRTKESINVIQLETAIGSGIKCFNNVIGINVPRSRFLPVKTTSDLLLLMSDLYVISHGTLVINPERQFLTNPLIKLGEDFKTVRQFSERFSEIPKISELDHLTVSGNVTFGKNTTLKGTVIIVANHGDQIDLPDGCKLENKIVSGNLRILEH
ncbi:hypothetical protein A3Q56_01605 [Intoshia linei]|uniref:UTP--glucose-1-phosphate uridylyltransferase n=1 Tax=Intoshia linei TaxID=1819745 RepID=A0A177B8K2_9BILA|nr:hypothetical protein A3Q56_01605 [Intoshia linei]